MDERTYTRDEVKQALRAGLETRMVASALHNYAIDTADILRGVMQALEAPQRQAPPQGQDTVAVPRADRVQELAERLRDEAVHWSMVPMEYADREDYCRGRADALMAAVAQLAALAAALRQMAEECRGTTVLEGHVVHGEYNGGAFYPHIKWENDLPEMDIEDALEPFIGQCVRVELRVTPLGKLEQPPAGGG